MDEGVVRELRRIKMYLTAGKDAILNLRLGWRDRNSRSKELWRLTQIIDIALDDAEDKMNWLIDSTERHLEEVATVHAPTFGARLGGLKISFAGRPREILLAVHCDTCGQRVEEGGTILYETDPGEFRPSTGELFFFHKGCCHAFEQSRSGRTAWFPLQHLPRHLALGLGMRVRKHQGSVGWIIDLKQSAPNNESGGDDTNRSAPTPQKTRPVPVTLDPRRSFSAMQKQEILLRSNGHCVSCGSELGLDWHADHIYPHSLGGVTEVVNGQSLCQPCNSRKHAKVLTVDG